MRTTLLLVLLLALTGCRTTHEADADEHQRLDQVDGSVRSSSDGGMDFGEASVGLLSGVYAPLMYLSDKDREDADGSASSAILHTDDELALLRQATFLETGAREDFPECIVETENSVVYEDCGFGASASIASVGFSLDGSYEWTDNSSVADLAFDFGVDAVGLGVGTSFTWAHDLAWTDTKFDGSFDLDYTAGASLMGNGAATTVGFTLNATIEELEGSDDCDGPVAGLVDWSSRYREGMDPPETTRVTVEWTGCGEALVTW